MRIAISVSHFPLLTETFILNTVTGLLKRGHDVHILAYKPGRDLNIHEDVDRFRLLERTHYWGLPENRAARWLRALTRLPAAYRRSGATVFKSLNVVKYGKAALTLALLSRTLPYLRGRPYDILHSHHGPNALGDTFVRDIGAFTGRHVISFHGADVSRDIRRLGSKVYDRLFEKGDLLLCVSSYMAQHLESLGCDPRKIKVHRSGIELSRFPFEPQALPADRSVSCLSIGRLVEKKGFELAISAVDILARSGLAVRYDIVGTGPRRASLNELIHRHKLGGNVSLLGEKTQEEIAALLPKYHILLAPSMTAPDGNAEGIPNVIKEAMASGLIAIGTNHSGIPEIIEDGITGFLCREGSSDSLTQKVLESLARKSDWPQIRHHARYRVEREYDVEKLNDDLVRLYEGPP